MRVPKVKPRRIYDRKAYGKDYLESDRDWMQNNESACVWFLENRDKINVALKAAKGAAS